MKHVYISNICSTSLKQYIKSSKVIIYENKLKIEKSNVENTKTACDIRVHFKLKIEMLKLFSVISIFLKEKEAILSINSNKRLNFIFSPKRKDFWQRKITFSNQ